MAVTETATVIEAPRVPSRESAANKGLRYLVCGRLMVREVWQDHVLAEVRGDSGVLHVVTFNRHDGWVCTCPALTSACSHARAVRSVALLTVPEDVS